MRFYRPLCFLFLVIWLAVFILILSGCKALDGYERTWGVEYVTPEGQAIKAGVTLRPIKAQK